MCRYLKSARPEHLASRNEKYPGPKAPKTQKVRRTLFCSDGPYLFESQRYVWKIGLVIVLAFLLAWAELAVGVVS